MKVAAAPNQRMETIAGNLEKELTGRTEEENMFELLSILGLSKPDQDGTAVFKKEKLIPESTLRFYVLSALRLNYFSSTREKFKDYSSKYWKKFPKDRIMQLYAQASI